MNTPHTEESERNVEIKAQWMPGNYAQALGRTKRIPKRTFDPFWIMLAAGVFSALMLGFIAGVQFANWTSFP